MRYDLRTDLLNNIEPGNEQVLETIYEYLSPMVKKGCGELSCEVSCTVDKKICQRIKYEIDEWYYFSCQYMNNKIIEMTFLIEDYKADVNIYDRRVLFSLLAIEGFDFDDELLFELGYHLIELNTEDNSFTGKYYYYDKEAYDRARRLCKKPYHDSVLEYSDFAKVGLLPDEETQVKFIPEGDTYAQKLYDIDKQLEKVFIKKK